MNSNPWVESIQDYNDLCHTCLEAIGYSLLDSESLLSVASELLDNSDIFEDDDDYERGEETYEDRV